MNSVDDTGAIDAVVVGRLLSAVRTKGTWRPYVNLTLVAFVILASIGGPQPSGARVAHGEQWRICEYNLGVADNKYATT